MKHLDKPLATKFGPHTVVQFVASKSTPCRCLGFLRAYNDPRVQLSGRFCESGTEFVERSTLACALDRSSFPPTASQKSPHCSLRRNLIAAIAASAIRFRRRRRNITACGRPSQIVRKRAAPGAERHQHVQLGCQIPFGEIAHVRCNDFACRLIVHN